MKITEIITESQELEEGWKQKLAGAALAGAAMLGGGHATDASAQTLNLPDAVWQQADKELGLSGKTNTQKTSQQTSQSLPSAIITAEKMIGEMEATIQKIKKIDIKKLNDSERQKVFKAIDDLFDYYADFWEDKLQKIKRSNNEKINDTRDRYFDTLNALGDLFR